MLLFQFLNELFKKINIHSGTPMDAAEAEKRGLVSKVVAADQLVETVVAVADKIASNSKLINQVPIPPNLILPSLHIFVRFSQKYV
jgi:enoyl-CoA hydratase/carnithine racemase